MPLVSIISSLKRYYTNGSLTATLLTQKPDKCLSYEISMYAALSGCSKNSTGLGAPLSTGHVHGDVYTQTIFMN